jgi:DNA-directed RNA polymerase subunit M/transcription elongation factor TFIIS
MSIKEIKEHDFRNRFLCKSCKKMLISKEALDNHITSCYENKIEKMKDEHSQEIQKIKDEYENKIDDITEYMTNYINTIEEKHTKLNNYLISQIQKLASIP